MTSKLTSLVWIFLPIFLSCSRCGASPLHKPPQIVKELTKQVELKTGSFHRFVLECRGDADPAPTYQWYKDSHPLSQDSVESQGIQLISGTEYSQLDFSNPAPEHEGYYYCEATNNLGKARSMVSHVAPAFPPVTEGLQAPVFTKAPKKELKSIGSHHYYKVELREGFKKKRKKWLDLSNAHLAPASQAERWIKKNQKFQFFFMSLLSL